MLGSKRHLRVVTNGNKELGVINFRYQKLLQVAILGKELIRA